MAQMATLVLPLAVWAVTMTSWCRVTMAKACFCHSSGWYEKTSEALPAK
jgi:hypothetical protein